MFVKTIIQVSIFFRSYQHSYIKIFLMIQERQQEQLRRIEEIKNRVVHENLIPQHKQKSQTDQQFILSCLKNHFVFYNLTQSQLNNVKDFMWWTQIASGVNIFRQGDQGTCFFIISNGLVEVQVDGTSIKTLKSGDGFGQLALLYDLVRPSSVNAMQNTGMWVLDKISFREAVQQIVIKQFQENQKYLEGLSFYQFLTNKQKEKVASSFVTLKYYKGQNIIEEGDPGSAFYIIKSGTASLIQGNVQQRKIYKGQSFGVNSLYYNTVRKMTVRADEEVVCQVLGRETLAKIVGQQFYKDIMFKNFVKFTLQKNRELFLLIKKDEEKVFENIKTRYYKTNQVVCRKGSTVQKLIIIVEGKIKKFRSANFLAQAGQCWGETYLPRNQQARLEDDIITATESVLIQISLENLRNVSKRVSQISLEQKSHFWQQAPKNQIIYVGKIQSQGMCTVHYLKYKNRKLVGKLFDIERINTENLGKVFNNHLQVLTSAFHPFLPTFQQIIQKQQHTMIVSQYIKGQSLYEVIRDIGLLSSNDAQFYVASMLLLLEYFAHQQIIVRDLKPDNFIVDEKGFIYLISLGSAKSLKKTHRTSTIIGTPHYMAPQIVLGKQYNEMVDLWAVGVMLFEFMVGQLPFGSLTQNPYQIYEQIIQANISFPRNFKDRRAKKIIQMMLCLNPEARHNGSYNNLKSNNWFQNINWQQLINKNHRTPYQPSRIKLQPMNLEEISLQKFLQKYK